MTVAEAAAAALVALAVAAFGEVMIEMTSSFARAAEDCLGFPWGSMVSSGSSLKVLRRSVG